jgi:hypothetical protein
MSFLRVSKCSRNGEEEAIQRWMDTVRSPVTCLPAALLAAIRDRWMQGRGMEMPAMRPQARLIEPVVRPLALGAFGFYLLWNGVWLAMGKMPISILTAFTGIPCPTTGGTRSVFAALQGHWLEAFLWNPLTPGYVLLMVYPVVGLARQSIRRERLALPAVVAQLWMFALAIGWVAKLAIGPKYW